MLDTVEWLDKKETNKTTLCINCCNQNPHYGRKGFLEDLRFLHFKKKRIGSKMITVLFDI